MRKSAILFLIIALLLTGTAAIGVACEQRRRPSRYLMPQGYVGWVRINFNVKGAPPTPIEDGYYLFKFPASGLIETSSDKDYGWGKDEYYYFCGNTKQMIASTVTGDGGIIWYRTNGVSDNPKSGRTVHEDFFVGTEEEKNKYVPENVFEHKPGAVNKTKLLCVEQ